MRKRRRETKEEKKDEKPSTTPPSSLSPKIRIQHVLALTIFLMILRNLPRVSAPAHDIVPELVPKRQGREARTRELCDRREVEAIYGAVNRIQECKGHAEGDDDGGGGGEGEGE